jgi:hypothetical protein
MNETIIANVDVYCQMVQTGKPCVSLAIQDRYVEEIVDRVDKFKLKTHVENLAEGWETLWIYKDKYMLEIIKSLPEPKTKFEHWILGKAFGYSDEAIKTFLENIGGE